MTDWFQYFYPTQENRDFWDGYSQVVRTLEHQRMEQERLWQKEQAKILRRERKRLALKAKRQEKRKLAWKKHNYHYK